MPTAPTAPDSSGSTRRRSLLSHPLTHLLLCVVVLILVQMFLVRIYQVPSTSMADTLEPGDRVLVNRLAADSVGNGDVVVFTHGRTWQEERLPDTGNPVTEAARTAGDLLGVGPSHTRSTVKRIIAGPGQTVECCSAAGEVLVDGQPLEEPYVTDDPPFDRRTLSCTSATVSTRCFPQITVPAGSYLVLGDHRGNSDDSVASCRGIAQTQDPRARDCARFVPEDRIIGRVGARVWPLSGIGTVRWRGSDRPLEPRRGGVS